MTFQNSCDAWDGVTGGSVGADLTPSGGSSLWTTNSAQAHRCESAVDYVTKSGLTPYITIIPHTSALAKAYDGDPSYPGVVSARSYAHSVVRLMEAKPFNSVRTWGVTNEPDCCGTKLPVAMATKIWRLVKTWSRTHDGANGNKAPCGNCRIVAGEFAWSNESAISYIQSYINSYPQSHGPRPFYWAFHDYGDVTYQDYHPHQMKDIQIQKFQSMLHNRWSDNRWSIYLSENGVILQHSATQPSKIYGHPGDQETDAGRFAKLQTWSNQISVVGYYDFFGSSCGWDSGLVEPPDPRLPKCSPPGSGSDNPDTTFRPAYCKLAIRPTNICDETSGH